MDSADAESSLELKERLRRDGPSSSVTAPQVNPAPDRVLTSRPVLRRWMIWNSRCYCVSVDRSKLRGTQVRFLTQVRQREREFDLHTLSAHEIVLYLFRMYGTGQVLLK